MSTLKSRIAWHANAQYVLAGATLLIAALFYVAFYRPQDAELRDLNRQVSGKRIELALNQTQADRLPRVARELEGLKRRLAGFKRLPPEPQLGQFIRDITQVSQRSALRRLTVRPGIPHRSELFSEQPITLIFQGDFTSVFSFIRQVEDMERLTRVRGVTIKAADSRLGTVDVTLLVNIYYSEG